MLRKVAEAIATATITGFWVYVIAYWALTGKLV
jgi:hypothetical protein